VSSTDYDIASEAHRANGVRIRELVESLLERAGLRVHSVTYRVKAEQSAQAKVKGSPDKYGSYRDLHDLLGVRVITHLATEVNAVVRVLRTEFNVDEARTRDKSSDLNPDEFGYSSFHLVVTLEDKRASLPEWGGFAGAPFEIQVRSILQHAWAEIEHDLGYKAAAGVPREIRRRFARLSGLLELADDEFDRLAVEAKKHARKASLAVKKGNNAPVDRDSLTALMTTEGLVRKADRRIASGVQWDLADMPEPMYANTRAVEMNEVGLVDIDDVVRAMKDEGDRVVEFAIAWLLHRPQQEDADGTAGPKTDLLSNTKRIRASPGLSLFYLYLHRLLVQQGDRFTSVPLPEDDDDDPYFFDEEGRRDAFIGVHDHVFGSRTSQEA
jgi:ppGpp synthetase/RelA/SpoT-type nucleotidyltranferase